MTCGRVPFVRRRADSVVAPLPWWLPGAGAACARTCAPVTIALHRCRLDAGDSARDVLPHPRRAPSETGAPFGGVPFRPVVFPDFAGDTLERRASIMPALSNNAPHYGARFLKVKRTGGAGRSMRRICARPPAGGRPPASTVGDEVHAISPRMSASSRGCPPQRNSGTAFRLFESCIRIVKRVA